MEEAVGEHHTHEPASNECCSVLVQEVRAPVEVVWSVVRRFDQPQCYKRFIRSCSTQGDLKVGSTREITVVSGLPATTSKEQLEILDEDKHILSFKVLDGDHRLRNYRSITTLHETLVQDRPGTLVMESYVVEIPDGNTREDTLTFTNTVVRCNLQSLARTCERLLPHAV
ncbi:hypothetical protein SELMODRAFT_231224 [Selaginella moellendorffii]|uniref:Uncharacterized protein n=2 Tax=Selaginella moellendorffii TaxID=88036 RepID=D8RCG8_SELML|nr:hypothetical protein SELMODRAFT_132071 [Selaginella moellendorffii]EFJ30129.1 hypothetical protein SELMODRAFT_231224 [Selaginella moellendorffii]